MAFDKQNRNLLQRMVDSCRRLLSEEFTKQLQELYGIQPGTGNIIDLQEMVHLTDDQYAIASLLRDRIEHLASGLSVSSAPPTLEKSASVLPPFVKGGQGGLAAIERLIREQAFTVLNRFAALRMCEERGIVKECVCKGMQSQGFQVYLQVAGTSLGDTYQRYKVFLYCLFDELAIDLGILFDRYSPFGLLFPREQALTELLNVINDPQLKDLWKEDETIGWVYQYFNTKEEREAMRKASQAPRNSRELAVRNQFFTPRYVVEFLTDNTLGRIWYEMTRGNTSLKDKCNYLVRRPNEIFLAEGEDSPLPSAKEIPSPIRGEGQGEGESNEDLLKQPVYIPHRPLKDPRRIAMLDPACGSMHFGLYAFELYETIYEEAWDNYPEFLTDIREQVADKEDFMKMVPEMIIRHNIHGIDIDPRACQIAGLSLWLRAQKSYQRLRLKPADRPMITKSNIVCAEPMPGEKEMLEEFIAKLRPPVLGDLVLEVWNKMQLAGEAGSLLKIEEELKTAIEKAKEEWERLKSGDSIHQEILFKELQKPVQQQMRFDVTGVRKKEFWDEAETLVLSALRDFAESATNGHGYQRKLFTEDAVQGFAFIDLCRKRFDVVLMNPPFGTSSVIASEYLKSNFSLTHSNLACCFIECAINKLLPDGFHGVIVDMATSIRSSYEGYRKDVLYKAMALTNYCSLGWDVLDNANVETCCFAVCKSSILKKSNPVICFDLEHGNEKGLQLNRVILSGLSGLHLQDTYLAWQAEFEKFPNGVPNFKLPTGLRRVFTDNTTLDPYSAEVCTGVSTGDNGRFYKLYWEVQPALVGSKEGWPYLTNGGEFAPFYREWQEVIDWRNNGKAVRSHTGAYIRNESKYFSAGLTYGKRGKYFSVQFHPVRGVFTNEGQTVFPNDIGTAKALLAVLNTKLLRVLINEYCGQHKENGYVKLLPIAELHSDCQRYFDKRVDRIYEILQEEASHHVEHAHTIGIRLLDGEGVLVGSLKELFRIQESELKEVNLLLKTIDDEINDYVFKMYSLGENDIAYINSRCKDMMPLNADFLERYDYQLNACSEAIDFIVGLVYGRWDIRIALDEKLTPRLPDPFDPLPGCPPGMLIGNDGFPATQDNIVSKEWLRARPDVNTLPPVGLVKQPTISDSEYPIKIAWDGILVDDPTNQNDIISHIREVLEVIWKDQADPIEQEACDILGVKSLRDYFRKPSGFFADHLKRYSKSRRQAPIYWSLSTASGSYTLWIYYHRLTDQMLYKCVNDFVNPKIEAVSRGIEKLQSDIVRGGNSKQKEELSEQMDFLQELKGFRDELLRVAQLPYKPNLNDGVLITASPLHNLFNLPKWKKDLTECWKKLEAGEYDWAHLAYTIWPDRVREVCKRDRSIAIAHGLEDICWVKPPEAKTKKRKPADKKSSEKEGRKKTGGDYALEKMGLDFE